MAPELRVTTALGLGLVPPVARAADELGVALPIGQCLGIGLHDVNMVRSSSQ